MGVPELGTTPVGEEGWRVQGLGVGERERRDWGSRDLGWESGSGGNGSDGGRIGRGGTGVPGESSDGPGGSYRW